MDCYDEILNNYHSKDKGETKDLDKWLNNYIIRLMTKYYTEGNILTIQNCLILLLNLFFDIDHPDHYHTKGKAMPSLTESEFKHFYVLMRRELERNNKRINRSH